jgi:hypothetical protein
MSKEILDFAPEACVIMGGFSLATSVIIFTVSWAAKMIGQVAT